MISKKCKICGKVIEGYNPRQVAYMMEQHNYTHRTEEEKKEETQ